MKLKNSLKEKLLDIQDLDQRLSSTLELLRIEYKQLNECIQKLDQQNAVTKRLQTEKRWWIVQGFNLGICIVLLISTIWETLTTN